MASDGAQNDTGDSFYEDISNESGATDNRQHRINFLRDDFPQPLWGFRSLESRSKLMEHHYLGEAKILEEVLGRRLTSNEQEGVAYWSNKELQIRNRSSFLGFLAGSYRAYSTRKTFNFPFWKPGEKFNPNVLKILGMTFAEGRSVRIFYHTMRTGLYALVAGPFIASLIGTSLGVTTAAAGRMKDPRTKDMYQVMREQHQRVMKLRFESAGLQPPARFSPADPSRNAPSSAESDSPSNNGFDDSFAPDQPSSSFDPDSRQAGASADYTNYTTWSPADNSSTSPSSPSSSSSSPSSSSSSSPNSGMLSSRSSRSPPFGNQSTKPRNPSLYPWESERQSERQPERQSDRNQDSGFFDTPHDNDASPSTSYSNTPSASSSSSSPQSSSSSSSRGENAWDRLRSGTSSDNNNNNNNNNSTSQRGDERLTSQQEFDAKVERERQGRDF